MKTKKIICIVDDEEDLVENLKIELEAIRPNWKIITFSEGMKAIQEIVKDRKSVV